MFVEWERNKAQPEGRSEGEKGNVGARWRKRRRDEGKKEDEKNKEEEE